jgi:hypothetical protein
VVPVQSKVVAVATIKGASYNPPNRTADALLVDLKESMKKVGLLYPILIDENSVIIDGHRRVAVAKLLGWATIEARVVQGDRDEIYATVNVSSRKMTGNDALCVWLQNPKAVSVRQAKRFQGMHDAIGRPLCVRIANNGSGYSLYDIARQIANYCGNSETPNICATVKWLLEIPRMTFEARTAMRMGQPGKILLKAIMKMKPVKLSLEVDD